MLVKAVCVTGSSLMVRHSARTLSEFTGDLCVEEPQSRGLYAGMTIIWAHNELFKTHPPRLAGHAGL